MIRTGQEGGVLPSLPENKDEERTVSVNLEAG